MATIPLSVVILAKNEADRIGNVLDAVCSWADEVLVIDDESTDGTVEVALKAGAQVLKKKMLVEGAHRNWAQAQAAHQWVFSLDADENPTEALKKEIAQTLAQPAYDAYTIPRRNFIGDYWIRWGGFYPAPQLKLFRKDLFRWEEVEVHPRAFLSGQCGHLTGDLLHYTYRDCADFIRKLNTQTTWEARKWFNLSKTDPQKARYKMNPFHVVWRMFDRFLRSYLRKKGYRDGFIGFLMSWGAAGYQLVSYAKYRELIVGEPATQP